ncbi:MAG: VCBS repeat-containing protein, partial [Deltaproteobacteria bacterium]|nr:VCBS repeat-containing protein [Deltaproteobacteria bacterium]
KRLAAIADLGKYDGVIATLGVRGRYHVVTDAEAAQLASHLSAGGRVWLEGGDFFTAARQPATALLPYLAAWGTGEASGKIAPPVTGRAFLEGLSAGVSAGPLNASNGLLARAPGTRAREVLRLEGASPVSALAVSHEGAAAGGGTWRTVGSSFPWSALVGGETPSMILAATLGFLEDGYGEVACQDATPCDDQDPCTVDACTGGACANALLPGCTECLDDAVMRDGVTPSCGAAEACVVADGRCTPIACGGAPCTIVAAAEGEQMNRVFTGASPARSEIAIPHAGNLVDLQVKVRLSNLSFRGPVRLTLQAPDGRTVVLKDYDAGVQSDLYATYDAGVPPVGSLDGLAIGAGGAPMPVAGTWALIATVDPAGFPVTGRIAGWQIHASRACDPRFTGEDCAACAPGWTGAGCATSKVFFSEYVEGSGNNKAVEIHNASDAPVDLSGCAVRTYYNGATTPASVITLSSTLPPGGSVTICHHLGVAPACDQASSEPSYLSFNGDDAVELWCGTTRDAIGQIGVDPGAYWASGAVQTQDRTLRRACSVAAGDTNGTDAFDPAAEWEVLPIDTLDGLDWRGCACALSPCVHGTCTNAGDSYTCACAAGWEGRDCDVNTDDCTPDPCVHGACTDLVAGYSCACDAGWYGDTCASDTDWCTPNPCVHGQCTIGVTGPDCACEAGWTGATCGDDIDDCTPNPCVHGTCTDGVASHTCACDAGFAGADCDRSALFFSEYVEGTGNNKAVEVANAGLVALDRGACSVRIYANGSATPTATVPLTAGSIASGGIWVLCNPALAGAATWCDQTSGSLTHNGDDAIDLFCGGAVRDVFGKVGQDPGTAWGGLTADRTLRRKCAIGGGDATGDDAFDPTVEWDALDADTLGGLKVRGCKCLPGPCAHGTCVDLGTSERCACSAGWTGDNCDVETNECDPNPCLNGGTCTDGVGSFTCDCPNGWAGATCNVILGTADAWCQVVEPGTIALEIGAFGTAWSALHVPGLTDRDDGVNTVAGLRSEAGVGPDGTNPWGAGWAWATATGQNGSSGNDRYSADLGGIPVPGSFDFAFRYSLDAGATWKYCDRDGSTPSGGDPQSGYATAQAGTLAVGCPAGQYDSGGACLPCSAQCSACTGAAACTACEAGFFLHGNSCYASCPVGRWENPATRTCDACAAECEACETAADDCTACVAGYVLSGASCVPGNPDCTGRTTLTAGTALSTGNGPSVVALGDVNGDGKADAVVANRLSNTVSVLLGNGDGTFQPKTDYAVTAPAAMVVADVDADGNLDVAAASASTPSGVATVFWGNGDGSFVTPGATATTTGLPYGFAAGRLNADARLDIAAGGTSTNQVSVILHSDVTARTFGAKVDTGLTQPMSLAIGTLDGTNVDIVSTSRSSNVVRVLRNNGAGGFTLFGTSYATGSTPDALVLADVTGDGRLDALTTNRGASTLSVLPGNGARGFGARTDFTTGSTGALPVTYSRTFALVDVNADGRPDAVVPDQSNAKVSVLLATGSTPIFGTRWTVDVGSGPISTAGGDVNNDGRPDVLVANYLGNSVSVLIAGCESTPACADDGNPCTVEAWQPLNNACGWTNDATYAEECYTGAAGTKDVGNCRGGTKTCTGGVLGACTGQVLPASETCDGEDDDCDGWTDNGSLCGDGIACTDDVCAGLAGCTNPVAAGSCLISGTCRVAGDREPGQTCSGCVSGATAWGPLTGVACDDGQSCTTGDQCTAGTCAGAAAGNGTACDDGDGCTTGEVCASGQCGGGTGLACAAPDACHQAGACTFDRCAFPAAADGTACGG